MVTQFPLKKNYGDFCLFIWKNNDLPGKNKLTMKIKNKYGYYYFMGLTQSTILELGII